MTSTIYGGEPVIGKRASGCTYKDDEWQWIETSPVTSITPNPVCGSDVTTESGSEYTVIQLGKDVPDGYWRRFEEGETLE